MENHKERPEFKKALSGDFGENIRHSTTTNETYLYYAKSYNNYIIRAAVVYDTQLKAFLSADRVFIRRRIYSSKTGNFEIRRFRNDKVLFIK